MLDDYPYWVAKKFGYFGDLDTTLEPGPMEATATVKLVDQGQSDMGYPSPGVFSLGLEQGIPLVSVWHMGAYDVFSFAFPKGKKPAERLKALKGKKILLGAPAGSRSATRAGPAGVDPASVKYVEAGGAWGQALSQGRATPRSPGKGLRAQWTGQGLDFDYLLRPTSSRSCRPTPS